MGLLRADGNNRKKKRCSWLCVRLVAVSTIEALRTGSWSHKTVRILERRRYFEHMLHLKECAIN